MALTKTRFRFRSVLCSVDFSEHSRLALRYAARLAGRTGGHLHVIFVNDPFLVAAAAAAYNTHSLGAASSQELRRFVASTLPSRTLSALRVTYETVLGKPAREILKAVARSSHDIIVLGTKGLSGPTRLLLGSTTSEILRKTPVPVLAVPPMHAAAGKGRVPASWPGRQWLVPVELGVHAADDIGRAAAVAGSFGASLLLAHTVPTTAAPSWLSSDLSPQVHERMELADAALRRLQAKVKVRTTAVIRSGYPPDEIARLAEEKHSGLIVMTLRGRQGLFGNPAGSIAYLVLCHAVAPVLALPVATTSARRPRRNNRPRR